MTAIATRSPVERRTARFLLRAPPALTLVAMSVAIAPRGYTHDSEDRLLLLLDALARACRRRPGLFRKDCSDGIITVEAKSGRVSRSMYCAMCLVAAISFASFFCSGEYARRVRVLVGAEVARVDLEVGVSAGAVPRNSTSFFAPSMFFGFFEIM